jgi:hypothetical protein
MGKKKDAAKADKSKTKIPKQIAGVKIPKTLRDGGKAAMKLAQNPVARDLLSAGLVAAATAVAANSRARKAAVDGTREAADTMAGAAATASTSAAKIGAALVDAAGSAAERFLGLTPDGSTEQPAATAQPQTVAAPVKPAAPKRPAKPAAASEFPLPTDEQA